MLLRACYEKCLRVRTRGTLGQKESRTGAHTFRLKSQSSSPYGSAIASTASSTPKSTTRRHRRTCMFPESSRMALRMVLPGPLPVGGPEPSTKKAKGSRREGGGGKGEGEGRQC
eukprot:3062293-Rhodomonas_salina.1